MTASVWRTQHWILKQWLGLVSTDEDLVVLILGVTNDKTYNADAQETLEMALSAVLVAEKH